MQQITERQIGTTVTIFLSCLFAAKHPHPFDDQVVIYIRHIGPDVIVGQAWQEGKDLQQVPKKLGGEILMVKDLFLPRELE